MNPFIIISASLGYATESVFGFGGSIVTFLLLTQSIPAKEAVSLLPIFAIAGSLFIVISDYRSVMWVFIGKVLLFVLPGLLLGSFFMSYVPELTFRLFVLSIIFIYGVNLIRGKDPTIPPRWSIPLYITGGFIIGATSLGVFLVPVIGSRLKGQRVYRASLGFLWLATAVARLYLYMMQGILSTEGVMNALPAVPFLLAATLIGYYIHRMIPEAHYKKYVGIAIILTACVNTVSLFV